MDVTRAIQAAVARADMLACRIAALPWGEIGLAVAIAAAVVFVVSGAHKERGNVG